MNQCRSMPYEKVTSTRTGSDQSKISLRKSGGIGINSAALREHFQEDTEEAEVFYDAEENKIGLLPLDESTDESYSIVQSGSSASVSPSGFLKQNELVPDVTTHYEPFVDTTADGDELISIDLEDPIGTYGSPDSDSE